MFLKHPGSALVISNYGEGVARRWHASSLADITAHSASQHPTNSTVVVRQQDE